jgi:zinc transport system substrate-binding protein
MSFAATDSKLASHNSLQNCDARVLGLRGTDTLIIAEPGIGPGRAINIEDGGKTLYNASLYIRHRHGGGGFEMSMRRWVAYMAWILAAGGLLSGCGRGNVAMQHDARMQVMASILPLADFARQVGGDRVSVEVLVPAGASPHTYEPTPAQLKALSRARVLILNGIGLEFWANKLISASDNPVLAVIKVNEGIKVLAGDEDSPGGNPHVWLSPQKAMLQVEKIRDAFSKADPEGAELYRANTDRYLGELHALDQEIRAAVAGYSNRRIISFHAAWSYLAADYGLEEAAVIEARPGQEPSPAEISGIIRKAKEIKARAIFAEPQFSSKAAETIAGECNARVLMLNPLGLPPGYHYLDTMRYNLNQISQALR